MPACLCAISARGTLVHVCAWYRTGTYQRQRQPLRAIRPCTGPSETERPLDMQAVLAPGLCRARDKAACDRGRRV